MVDFCSCTRDRPGCYQTAFYTITFHTTKNKKHRKYIPAVFYQQLLKRIFNKILSALQARHSRAVIQNIKMLITCG